METTRLSSKGQVVIPKVLRDAQRWEAGLELDVIPVEGGVMLRARAPFEATSLADVAGCLPVAGPPKSDYEIAESMRRAARGQWRGA